MQRAPAATIRLPKPPQQKRSHETQARLLVAAERLLADRPFEQITVGDIVREAGLSVGAFYARFSDKTAVLLALYERYDLRLAEEHRDTVLEADSIEELALNSCRRIVRYYRERRWFMRAICMFARSHPEAISEEVRERRFLLHRRLAEPFTEHAADIVHDDPLRAAEWVLFVAASVTREKVLFGEVTHASSVAASDEELANELSRTMIAYLRSAPPTSQLEPKETQ